MQLIGLNIIFTVFLYLVIQDQYTIEAVSLIGNDDIEEYVETCHNTLNLPKINWNFVQIFCTQNKLIQDQDNEVPIMDINFMTSDNIEFRHCHGLLNIKSSTVFENQCFRNVVLLSEWQKWLIQDIRDEYTYWRQNPALRTISCYTRRQDNYTKQRILNWYQEQLKCLEKQKGGFYSLLPNIDADKKRHPVFE